MPQTARLDALQSHRVTHSLFLSLGFLSFFLIYHMALYLTGWKSGLVIDFGVFHLVGKMFWLGTLDKAYSVAHLSQVEAKLAGVPGIFIPWSYPPQFNFVTALLSLLPLIPAYVVFTLSTYLGYLAVLRTVAGKNLALVFLFIFPSILIEITCGQNGFLTGALVGLFVLGMQRGRAIAGIPLGLMAIKPHLALGLALFVLLKRRWDVLGAAVATTLVSLAAATLVFGTGIWPAFLEGARAVSENMALGYYPMLRMTSVYASLLSFGLPTSLALPAQIAAALLACGLILRSHLAGHPFHVTLGIATVATLAISPYNYDYDLPIAGIGIALLLPTLVARARIGELVAITGLYWIAAGTGFSSLLGQAAVTDIKMITLGELNTPTLAGPAFLLVMVWIAAIAHRAAQPGTAPA
ncbi:glycosyltransferase family 87 protein [Acidimangrovimonas pyrenivorans]|uniref:Glycosyltransferase family 87 protein n=1 Tax=Acidimangrovimonas pyrenivorans TaxID=2030798 RepID=A0ABV7AI43_9RHOB